VAGPQFTPVDGAAQDLLGGAAARDGDGRQVRRIRWPHHLLPGLVILPAHDSTPYGTRLIRALLDGDGGLTDDACAETKAYERETFGSDYRLNPARVHAMCRASTGRRPGRYPAAREAHATYDRRPLRRPRTVIRARGDPHQRVAGAALSSAGAVRRPGARPAGARRSGDRSRRRCRGFRYRA
jgi:hypothetical protein